MADEGHPLVPSTGGESETVCDVAASALLPQRSLCNCQSATAASPDGAVCRPLAISETVDGAAPIAAAISATVIPFGGLRRSAMRDFHVLMQGSLRNPVTEAQRHVVTGFRDIRAMAGTDNEWPGPGSHIGERIKYWRLKRKLSRKQLGASCGLAQSTIGDLENQLQDSTTVVAKMADALRINAQYLETGEGHPESLVQQVPPRRDWPSEFPPIELVASLEPNERKLAGKMLAEAIAEIKANRVRPRRRGS